jgi:hypothetical protein
MCNQRLCGNVVNIKYCVCVSVCLSVSVALVSHTAIPLKELTKRKLLSHSLRDWQQEHRVKFVEDFIQTSQTIPHFLSCVFTGGESWVCQYNPERKTSQHGAENKITQMFRKFHLQKSRT